MAYAETTKVPVGQTRLEIEKLLTKHGADAFGFMGEIGSARIAFRLKGRHYRMMLPLPTANGPGSARKDQAGQIERARWRALLLIIKARLEAVAAGITTIEDEFLAATVLPDGSTVGEWAKPELALAYEGGGMPGRLMIEGQR